MFKEQKYIKSSWKSYFRRLVNKDEVFRGNGKKKRTLILNIRNKVEILSNENRWLGKIDTQFIR